MSDGYYLGERNRAMELSRTTYLLLLTTFTALGIAFSGIFAYTSREMRADQMNWLLFWGLVAVTIVGVIINKWSENPAISMFGFALVAGPFGFLLGPIIATKAGTTDVWRAFFISSITVIIFGVIGAMIKTDLGFLNSVVIGLLSMAIVGYLGIYVLGAFGVNVGGALGLLDWAVIALFMGITAYDINQALHDDWTLDNAVDYALNVYLDWLNIFIRLLGRKN